MLTASGLVTGVMISSPADMRAPTRWVVRKWPASGEPGSSSFRLGRSLGLFFRLRFSLRFRLRRAQNLGVDHGEQAHLSQFGGQRIGIEAVRMPLLDQIKDFAELLPHGVVVDEARGEVVF